MISNYIRENKGKSLLIVGIVLMWGFLFWSFNVNGYEETWQFWGVPTERPIFRDFQLIPGSAESFRNGFEPSIENPYDPGQRIFNYPAFWRLFFYTSISTDDALWIGISMIVLFFIGVMIFPEKLSTTGAIWMLLIIFSPAPMLLYERGNADLIVFFICAMAILATDHSAGWTVGLLIFGSIVKMFPFFGMTILLKEPKRKFIWLTAGSILFMLVYGSLTFKSQSAAWNTTMRGDGLSYGAFVFITRFNPYFQRYFPNLFSYDQWRLVFEVLAIILIIIAVIPAIRSVRLPVVEDRNLAAFRMGASIYVGTFLLGNNWDYRLAFLVFVIPQLAQWVFFDEKRFRLISISVMIATLLACWSVLVPIDLPLFPLKDSVNRIFIVDEIVNWLLVPGFTYLLVASFPGWLKVDLQKIIGANRPRTMTATDASN